MAAIPPEEFVHLWSSDAITAERALGHVLQHIARMHVAHDALSQRVSQLQNELARTNAPATVPASTPRTTKATARPAETRRRGTKG